MFIKIVFFFLIGNVALGFMIAQLNSDPIDNPNTTLFSARNITESNVTSSINTTAFHDEQFTPENETGDTASDFFDIVKQIDIFNTTELLEFLDTWNVFFVTQQMDNMLTLVGVEFPPGLLDGLGVIFTFAAIMWFIFVIFKVGASSFN